MKIRSVNAPRIKGNRWEFGSQTATRLTNRPKLRGFLPTRKPRRFAGTAWWAMHGSNLRPLLLRFALATFPGSKR